MKHIWPEFVRFGKLCSNKEIGRSDYRYVTRTYQVDGDHLFHPAVYTAADVDSCGRLGGWRQRRAPSVVLNTVAAPANGAFLFVKLIAVQEASYVTHPDQMDCDYRFCGLHDAAPDLRPAGRYGLRRQ